jgi:hypothetical protein
VGRPRSESCESEPGTHEVRVHAVRLGGRHRLDASRVFSTGRSQGLLVHERALARKKSVAPPDAGRGWADGETVRVCAGPLTVSECTAYRSRLAGSRYDERRFRANARLALTGTAKQKSSDSQVQLRITIREERDDGQHIGRTRIPTRVCLRVTKRTSEVDTVR